MTLIRGSELMPQPLCNLSNCTQLFAYGVWNFKPKVLFDIDYQFHSIESHALAF